MRQVAEKPFCACGCGNRVKRAKVWRRGKLCVVRYYQASCVPKQVLGSNRSKGPRFAEDAFDREIGELIAIVKANGKMTREDLREKFIAVARQYWDYSAAAHRRRAETEAA